MANLFWKTSKVTKVLLDRPFKTEEEFERTVFETSELLEDIFLLKRQVRGGTKTGIPDIVGIDGAGNVCIIELKNTEVDADIIPQVLKYAIWAETNPDSVKSLWHEWDNKPENLKLAEVPQVRVLVIAPTILRSTLAVVNKINYKVDLIEVKRWVEGDDHFLLVNKLEEDARALRAPRPVSGLRTYDARFYKTERNDKSVEAFMRYSDELDALVRKKGWELERKFNRSYCGFKAGFFNAFGIQWWGTKTFGVFVKISQAESKGLSPRPSSYDERWKQAYYLIEIGKTKMSDFQSVFEFAYRKVAGSAEN